MKTTHESMHIMEWAIAQAWGREITIYNDTKFNSKTVTWGINWAALGTQSIEKTMQFADNLKIACKIVEYLNREQITVDWEMDEEHYDTVGEMKEVAEKAKYMIVAGRAERAMKMIFEYDSEF